MTPFQTLIAIGTACAAGLVIGSLVILAVLIRRAPEYPPDDGERM